MDGPARDGDEQRERAETPAERIDRNWAELLQEVRVTQTGVQILGPSCSSFRSNPPSTSSAPTSAPGTWAWWPRR